MLVVYAMIKLTLVIISNLQNLSNNEIRAMSLIVFVLFFLIEINEQNK